MKYKPLRNNINFCHPRAGGGPFCKGWDIRLEKWAVTFTQMTVLFLLLLFLLTSCSRTDHDTLSGYIEGEYTYVAGGVAGTLFSIDVVRGQAVKKNDLLYGLDPQPDLAFLRAAKANIDQLQPQIDFAKIQLSRQKRLLTSHFTSQSSVDEAQKEYDTLTKQLVSTQNAYTQAQWAVQQKTVHAPVTGQVFDVFFRLGEKVTANQPVLALLAPENINVLFYIPQKQLSSIHLGQIISFGCDGCNQLTRAKISYISPEAEYTPPIIYGENTRYNLVYLVRAVMPPAIAVHFHPGQPIDIYLHE